MGGQTTFHLSWAAKCLGRGLVCPSAEGFGLYVRMNFYSEIKQLKNIVCGARGTNCLEIFKARPDIAQNSRKMILDFK